MPSFTYEQELWQRNVNCVAGIDEAGRGPLAGPVMAAAVILPHDFELKGLDDSKKISPKKREQLYQELTQNPHVIWSVASASAQEIDQINILKATHLAMKRAVDSLATLPQHCLIDGLPVPHFPYPQTAIVKGDSISLSIAAASIIAKITRDRYMHTLDAHFPEYGFRKHQGYGTAQHLKALKQFGACSEHRHSFKPIAQSSLNLS